MANFDGLKRSVDGHMKESAICESKELSKFNL